MADAGLNGRGLAKASSVGLACTMSTGGMSLSDRVKRGPPLASIESLLSFEAKSTPR